MTARSGCGGKKGFSLIELLVVLSILAGLLALVAPSLSGTLESGRLRASAAEIRATFSQARSLAVNSGSGKTVSFDIDAGRFGIDNVFSGLDNVPLVRSLPDRISIASVRKQPGIAEHGAVRVRFRPDGSAEEAEVRVVSGGGGAFRITVDPLTGLALTEAGT